MACLRRERFPGRPWPGALFKPPPALCAAKNRQTQDMKKLEILRFPDPRLRQKGRRVEKVTPDLARLGEAMLNLMHEKNGVGLAAVQVGLPLRLLVADTRSEFEPPAEGSRYDTSLLKQSLAARAPQPLILFNPEIVQKEGSLLFPEGCLSFPSYFAEVKRAETVQVKALDEKGEPVLIKTDGLLSICLQHEIDHLDGRLFIDHLSPLKASRLREEIKKNGYPEDAPPKEAPAREIS